MENRKEFLEKIRNTQLTEKELEQVVINGLDSVAKELEILTDGLSLFLQMAEDREVDSKNELKLQLVLNRMERFLGDAHGMYNSTKKELENPNENGIEVERV